MEKVILGMPGDWAKDNYEIADHYTSKIGGLPDWPISNFDISSELLECIECKNKLCLIAQVYAPISNKTLSIEERVIYIFGCVMPSCGSTPSSWRALRVQNSLIDQELVSIDQDTPSDSRNKSKKDVWNFDFKESDDDIDLEDLSRAFSEVATLSSNSKTPKHEPKSNTKTSPTPTSCISRIIDDKVPVLPCFYIHTQEEKKSKTVSSVSTITIKENESDDDSQEKWAEEVYEYDSSLNADRTYLKFMKRLDVYPDQCFRYSYGGKPLLSRGEMKEGGKCKFCGGSMVYELQIMPPVIYFLQEVADDQQRKYINNWNWITLIVYTCSDSCVQVKSGNGNWIVSEESIVIQYE